jgi:prepilin-type N-terminal cleavage/methylation domain-containing protein
MTSLAGNNPKWVFRGFTLVELLVVVAIMGVLAGAAAVSLRGLRSPALVGAANEVASAMKMTRQMAVASGRKMLLVFPSDTSATNLGAIPLRSYAIFECLEPGFETREAPAYTHPETANQPVFLAKTDWRKLPEGIFFCNFASNGHAPIAGDPFTGGGFSVGNPVRRQNLLPGSVPNGTEWQYFMSVTNLPIGRPNDPGTTLATLNNVPYVGFLPDGRAFYTRSDYYDVAGLRLVQGFVQNLDALAVTDTNSFYYIETDSRTGRIRVRSRDSYRLN